MGRQPDRQHANISRTKPTYDVMRGWASHLSLLRYPESVKHSPVQHHFCPFDHPTAESIASAQTQKTAVLNSRVIMSNQQSSSYSYSSTSYSSSSTSGTGETYSKSQTTHSSYNDRDGAFSERVTSETGKPTLVETTQLPAGHEHHRRVEDGGSAYSGQGRIEDVTDTDQRGENLSEADQRYLEAMEDEYAKREGGA